LESIDERILLMELRYPDYFSVFCESRAFETKEHTASFDDVKGAVCTTSGETLCISLFAKETAIKYLRLRWNFTEGEKRNDLVKVYGDVWERSYGDIEWRGIVPERYMPWVCAVSNGSDQDPNVSGRFTECFGVKTCPAAMCFWQYDANGITLWLDVRCGGEGVILGGRTLDVCEIVFGEYRDTSAFSALKKYYSLLCDAPLKTDHKIYGSNNWYYAYGKTSHEDIIKDTELLAELCKGNTEKPYMVIDAGWEKNKHSAPWGEFREGKFYDMQKLASEMSAKGVRPGIWTRPLRDVHNVVFPKDAPQRCVWDGQYLDPSHPDTLDYVKNTMSMICDWGYKLIKHDFSTFDTIGYWGFERNAEFAADGWHFYDRSKTTAEVFVDLNKAIYEATKGKAIVLGCNVIGHLAAGMVHLNRTGDDTSGKDWERVRKYGINTLAFRMLHHKNFYESDVDCIGIMGLIDWRLNSRWLDAVAHSGTPMFVSPNPKVVSKTEKADLKIAYKVNAIQEDELIPLDWMENICPEKWLLNGKPVTYDWYPEHGTESFDSQLVFKERE
jgi:alpha-galactosidase